MCIRDSFILDDEIESKINSHLKKMTIADKVGQTCQVTLGALMKTDSKNKLILPHEIDPEKLSVAINDYKIGSILNVSNHTFDLERWHEIIKTVQAEAMSSRLGIPIIYGIDLAAHCRPALQLGGDYYDFMCLKTNISEKRKEKSRWAFVIGDVMGKGIPAGLLMTMLRLSLIHI